MMNHFPAARDLLGEIIALVNSGQALSDIHLEQDAPIMVRTPRGWQRAGAEPITLEQMLPVLRNIDEDWEDKIVEGALDRPFVLTQCRLRCNVCRLACGEKVAISIRRLALEPIPLERTGLPPCTKTMLEPDRGIVLVAGPTGSGKTTTIASMLDHLNASRNAHIITIEEPIEYFLQRKRSIVSQKEVPTDTAGFAVGMRESLRQSPDILMVGEIRDADTAETVLHAAETGHLVLAALHANSAVGAIAKLIEFFPPEQRNLRATTLAGALAGVIYQGLLPTEGGDAYALASELIFNHEQQAVPYIIDAGKLPLLAGFMKRREDGMSRSLNDALAELVRNGVITAKDALRCAYNRGELQEMLR